ncbi:hypothetical protein [Zooshikella ganghwensis]|nr:hypothetical protein [Zooshikella ganghwensis]
MEADSPTDIPLTLEAVKAKFEAWRQRPKPGFVESLINQSISGAHNLLK